MGGANSKDIEHRAPDFSGLWRPLIGWIKIRALSIKDKAGNSLLISTEESGVSESFGGTQRMGFRE